MLTLVLTLVCTAQRDRFPRYPTSSNISRKSRFLVLGGVREDSEGNQHLTLGWAGGVGAMDARAAGDDAGGVSGEIEALRRSAMASSDDGRLEALSNLGHKLAWLCRIKYLDTMWWSPAGQRAEDAGRNRNASTSSDVDTGEQRARSPPRPTPPSLTSPSLSLKVLF